MSREYIYNRINGLENKVEIIPKLCNRVFFKCALDFIKGTANVISSGNYELILGRQWKKCPELTLHNAEKPSCYQNKGSMDCETDHIKMEDHLKLCLQSLPSIYIEILKRKD